MGKRSKTAALLLMLCLTLTACAPGQAQATPAPTAAETARPEETETPEEQAKLPYERKPVYIDGREAAEAYLYKEELFVPIGQVCEAIGFEASWEGGEDAFTARIEDAELSAKKGDGYLLAEGRYLYLPNGWLAEGDSLLLPADLLGRLLGLACTEAEDGLYISSNTAAVISGGEGYYDIYCSYEEVYWLAHVIHAEAYQQPLAGMIGVGNVVFNRVASDDFPDTVVEVVNDVEHVVQFEPVANGSIKTEPDEQSYIAAYLCIEGFNTVGDSLYFVNPDFGSGWFDNSLEFVVKIGGHNFYRPKGEDNA